MLFADREVCMAKNIAEASSAACFDQSYVSREQIWRVKLQCSNYDNQNKQTNKNRTKQKWSSEVWPPEIQISKFAGGFKDNWPYFIYP